MQVSVNALSYIYTSTSATTILKDISFSLHEGEFCAIIGPSGCGKTTLLRLIAGLLPSPGDAIHLDTITPHQALISRRIGWMAQKPALLPWLNVDQNITLPQRINNGKQHTRLAPLDALRHVGLQEYRQHYPAMLSGGMQQRLALARLLTLDTDLWLMDEPFASLDELTRERLSQYLVSLWVQFHPTILWVTHNIYEALRIADRIIVLSELPAKVIANLPNPIPRPRQDTHPDFQVMLSRLRGLLRLGEEFSEGVQNHRG